MIRKSPWILCAVLAAGLSVPAASQAAVTVQLHNADDTTSDIGSFSTASCKKGKGIFVATAKKNGLSLRVILPGPRAHTLRYGSGNSVTIRAPQGTFSTLNTPPNPPPAAGSVSFNRSRMGIAVTNALDSSLTSSVAVGGAVICKYPKKKKKKRRR